MSGLRRALLAFTIAVFAAAPALVSGPGVAAAAQPGQLTGVVRDDHGAALADATVWLTATSGGATIAAVRTDGAGRYTLPVPTGTYDVRVATTLVGARYGARIDDVVVGAAADLDIVVVRQVRFSGTVRDGSGAPLKNVHVNLNGSGAGMRTAADGAFAVDVVPGTWPLVASLQMSSSGSPQGAITASVERFELTGDRHQDLVMPVRPIDITVTSADGQPKTSGSVTVFGGYQCDSGCTPTFELFPGGRATVGEQVSASVGADGKVRVLMIDKPGMTVRVSDWTSGSYTEGITLPYPAPTSVTVAYRPTVKLQGVVRDSGGRPAYLPSVGLDGPRAASSTGTTGSEGQYSTSLPPDTYNFRLNAGWQVTGGDLNAFATGSNFVLPEGGRTQDFTVPGAPFTVKVVDAANQPLSGVTVGISSSAKVELAPGLTASLSRGSNLKSGSDGTATGQIVPGDNSVSVSAYTIVNGSLGSHVSATFDPSASPVVISLAGPGQGPRVSGVVRDAAGDPIGGLYVSLQGGEGVSPSTQTSAAGAYATGTSRPGSFTLGIHRMEYGTPATATLPGGMWWVSAPVNVTGTHTIDVTVPRATAAEVRLTTADGKSRKGTATVAAGDTAISLGPNLPGKASNLGQPFTVDGPIQPRLFGPTTVSVNWYSGSNTSLGTRPGSLAVSGIPLAPGGHLAVATAAPLSAEPPAAEPPATTPTTTPPATTDTTAPSGGQPAPIVKASNGSGYWMLGRDGKVYAFGDAQSYGDGAGGTAAVDLEPTPSGKGYWLVDEAGVVTARGDARSLGDVKAGLLARGEKVTSLSATPTGNGYWVFTDRGRVVPFGDAGSFGDMTGTKLNGPVLDSVPTPSGKGYYMVASDGGIFAFGDAAFAGSMGGQRLNAPVQSLVPDGDNDGYWLVASDGGIFAFRAGFRGSLGGIRLAKPVTGMVRFGDGYLMVGEDGGIFNFSDRPFSGSLGSKPPAHPIVSVAALAG